MKQALDDQTDEQGGRQGLEGLLKALFATQRFAVLVTQKDGQPYTNLVAFTATEDLKRLLFVTPRATRKFANFADDTQVSMMIDNRHNKTSLPGDGKGS